MWAQFQGFDERDIHMESVVRYAPVAEPIVLLDHQSWLLLSQPIRKELGESLLTEPFLMLLSIDG